jgi:hypothetical protein
VSEETDWDIPQWVQSIEEKDIVILTTGEHGGTEFEGTCLPCGRHKDGGYSTTWLKAFYARLEGVVPFEISND